MLLQGDSGGPLTVEGTLGGVVSHGAPHGCGQVGLSEFIVILRSGRMMSTQRCLNTWVG